MSEGIIYQQEQDLVDEVAKELYARRVFNIRDMKDYELEDCAKECYRKAIIFVKARIALVRPK
jgi:hypothetical protein